HTFLPTLSHPSESRTLLRLYPLTHLQSAAIEPTELQTQNIPNFGIRERTLATTRTFTTRTSDLATAQHKISIPSPPLSPIVPRPQSVNQKEVDQTSHMRGDPEPEILLDSSPSDQTNMASEVVVPSKERASLPSTFRTNMAALNQNPLITPPDPPEHDFNAIASPGHKSDDPVLVVDKSEVLPPTPTLSRSSSQSSSLPVQGLFDSEPVLVPQPILPPTDLSDSDYAEAIHLSCRDYDLILKRFALFRN
ncbi:hypothetical protein PHISCL_10309, partial [Aspergillus sclerotialis]